MVVQNQRPVPNNLTLAQKRIHKHRQFIRHAYMPFLKSLLFNCEFDYNSPYKSVQMKKLKRIYTTIKTCAQLKSASCVTTQIIKDTIANGEFYFVLSQICNFLRKQKYLFSDNEWDSVVITDNFYALQSGSPLFETKQLLIIIDNIKKFTMILYREEFEYLNLVSGTSSHMQKYIQISCAAFVLQKVSFQNQDTVNMFCKIYLVQLEQIVCFFKKIKFEDACESRCILSDFILSNLILEDEYHNHSAQNGNMTGTLGTSIHTAYTNCILALRQLPSTHNNRFDIDTIRQITHICRIVKLIRKKAVEFILHITQHSTL
jgi:hypothetical protein